jgi:hypothetical protein
VSLAVLGALVGVGVAVGFTSGLVGIGGGVLIVPFLYFFYAAGWNGPELAPAAQTTVAHATSLFIILPTALVGVRSFHRAGYVEWRAALPVGGFAVAGALLGARLAILLPSGVLRLGFGLFLLYSGSQLLRRPVPHDHGPLRVELARTVPIGLVVGLLSAMMGVGGGILAIPLLLYVVHLDMERVAATSLAVIAFAAVSGTLSYALAGTPGEVLPDGSLGYIHVAAALPMLLGSIPAVRLGARLNRRLHSRTLRMIFAIIFLVLGLRLVVANAGALL